MAIKNYKTSKDKAILIFYQEKFNLKNIFKNRNLGKSLT